MIAVCNAGKGVLRDRVNASEETMENNQKKMSWFREGDIRLAISGIKRVLESGVFSPEGMASPFFEPSVVYSLILLNDLLQKADDDGKRVTFSDDITGGNDGVDVTKLIRDCRNAACHIGSRLAEVDAGRFRFNVVAGRVPNAFVINSVSYGSDYDDDIAVFYGPMRLYLRRHFLRAYNDICEIYSQVEFSR